MVVVDFKGFITRKRLLDVVERFKLKNVERFGGGESSGSKSVSVVYGRVNDCRTLELMLDRKDIQNRITQDFVNDLAYVLKESSYKQITLQGDSSNRYFCTGGDLNFMYNNRLNHDEIFSYSLLFYSILLKLKTTPSLCLWNGTVMGGGLALSIWSKFRIATERTLLAMPESKFGFYTNCLFNQFISSFLPIKQALYMSLISRRFTSYEALNSNFANYFILTTYKHTLIDFIKGKDFIEDYNTIDSFLLDLTEKSLKQLGLDYKTDLNTGRFKVRDLNWEKSKEFIDKHFSNWWCFSQLLKDLTSESRLKDLQGDEMYFLKYIQLELQRRSRFCLRVNYDVTSMSYDHLTEDGYLERDVKALELMIRHGDMFEGIRGYFIEKDNRPRWKEWEDKGYRIIW